MSQPACPGAARAPSARDWPAPAPPAPPAHPQHRSPARRRITIAGLTPEQPMTAASPAATGPMATGSAATAARPQISARLPVSDWQVRWRLQPDGRTVLEVTDQAGNLTGLAASTRLPIVSVDGAWRGTRRSADGPGSGGRWPSATPAPLTARSPSPSPAGRAAPPSTRPPWTGCGSPPSPGPTPQRAATPRPPHRHVS